MNKYKLYKVNFNFDLVIAVDKDDLNPTLAFKEALENHIDSVVEHEISDYCLTFEKVTSVENLPEGWWAKSTPYHKYAEDPDSILGFNVEDIIASDNRCNEHLLLKISKLEEELAKIKKTLK